MATTFARAILITFDLDLSLMFVNSIGPSFHITQEDHLGTKNEGQLEDHFGTKGVLFSSMVFFSFFFKSL